MNQETRGKPETTEEASRGWPRGMLLKGHHKVLLPLCTLDPEDEAAARGIVEPAHWRLMIDHEREPAAEGEPIRRRTTAAVTFVEARSRAHRDAGNAKHRIHELARTSVTCEENAADGGFVKTRQAEKAVNALRDELLHEDGRAALTAKLAAYCTEIGTGTESEVRPDDLRRLAGAVANAWYNRHRKAAHQGTHQGRRRRYLGKTVRSLARAPARPGNAPRSCRLRRPHPNEPVSPNLHQQ